MNTSSVYSDHYLKVLLSWSTILINRLFTFILWWHRDGVVWVCWWFSTMMDLNATSMGLCVRQCTLWKSFSPWSPFHIIVKSYWSCIQIHHGWKPPTHSHHSIAVPSQYKLRQNFCRLLIALNWQKSIDIDISLIQGWLKSAILGGGV